MRFASPARRNGVFAVLWAPALVAALALGGCASSTSGFEDEGPNEEPGDGNLMKGFMISMGAVDPEAKPVEYQPRAPLVVPPKRDLPKPQDTTASLGANFPRNPEDVTAEMRRKGVKNASGEAMMTPDELARYRLNAPVATRPNYPTNDKDWGRKLTPQEMAGQAEKSKQALAEVEGGPNGKRRYLTDPPDGYKTPSTKAPIDPETPTSSKSEWWKFW
jgi:hypothetical protein